MASRKKFIKSHGATCRNWRWSWSFVNENQKFVIFGAWDHHRDGNRLLIFSEEWQRRDRRGRKNGAYKQSREHIRLVEEKGYQLKIFSQKKKDKVGVGPPQIESFVATLTNKSLKRVRDNWYASEDFSGKVPVKRYKRNRSARVKGQIHNRTHCWNSRRQRDGHRGVKS
jgi:5-methylcytosine-specific restriction protein A